MPEMNSRHSKTSKFLLHRPIYHLNLVIFGFLRYDLCLPITDFSVISAISLLFLCYICYGFSVMDRSRLYFRHKYTPPNTTSVQVYLYNYTSLELTTTNTTTQYNLLYFTKCECSCTLERSDRHHHNPVSPTSQSSV